MEELEEIIVSYKNPSVLAERMIEIIKNERKRAIEEYREELHERYFSNVDYYPNDRDMWNLDLEEIDIVAREVKRWSENERVCFDE